MNKFPSIDSPWDEINHYLYNKVEFKIIRKRTPDEVKVLYPNLYSVGYTDLYLIEYISGHSINKQNDYTKTYLESLSIDLSRY